MPYTTLTSIRDGAVERLTLNRPDVRNAFNDVMIAELSAWAEAIASDRTVRAVVIAGAGKAFSAGADLQWMARAKAFTEAENMDDAMRVSRMFAALDALPLPVVARVQGAALGGGAGLIAVCDIVVADADTVFGFTEVKLGIVPAVISPYVVAKIGRSAARQLFLTGARFSAARARDIGLVHDVVDAGELDATVDRYVAELLTGGPEAIRTAKALIGSVWNLPLEAAQAPTVRAIAERRVSDEGQEGLGAFLEKRKPRWSGV